MLIVPPGKGEVVQSGDSEHGAMDAVAFEAALTQDLPGLQASEGVLDTGADSAVGGVVLLFPAGEFGLAAFAAVWDDQAGAAVAAVRGDRGLVACGLRAGQFPRLPPLACGPFLVRQRLLGLRPPRTHPEPNLCLNRIPASEDQSVYRKWLLGRHERLP